jgi:hypothetical protein
LRLSKCLLILICNVDLQNTTRMTDKKQQLVLSIIDFLNKSIDDGTVKQDDREGLEVASAFLWFHPSFVVLSTRTC